MKFRTVPDFSPYSHFMRFFYLKYFSIRPLGQNAVAKVLAKRVAQGEPPCSSNTKSYCEARLRRPISLVRQLVRETGRLLHLKSEEGWKWKGRSIKLVDGTTVSMPDTPENQKIYPQPESQKEGVGFPITRIVAIISLSCGAVLDMAIRPYKGMETGEHALLRQIVGSISTGDIILGDRYYCSYFLIVMLPRLGADLVFQIHDYLSEKPFTPIICVHLC